MAEFVKKTLVFFSSQGNTSRKIKKKRLSHPNTSRSLSYWNPHIEPRLPNILGGTSPQELKRSNSPRWEVCRGIYQMAFAKERTPTSHIGEYLIMKAASKRHRLSLRSTTIHSLLTLNSPISHFMMVEVTLKIILHAFVSAFRFYQVPDSVTCQAFSIFLQGNPKMVIGAQTQQHQFYG